MWRLFCVKPAGPSVAGYSGGVDVAADGVAVADGVVTAMDENAVAVHVGRGCG